MFTSRSVLCGQRWRRAISREPPRSPGPKTAMQLGGEEVTVGWEPVEKLQGLRCVAFALAKLLETHCSYPHPYRSHRVIADDQISSSNNFPPLVNLLSSCDNLHQPPLAACHSPRHWQPLLPPLASRSSQAGSRNMVNSSVLRVTFAK